MKEVDWEIVIVNYYDILGKKICIDLKLFWIENLNFVVNLYELWNVTPSQVYYYA